ncbi:cellulase family glycosylhydrolase [candidate division KSB1 bacterium]|nr:cellulase family glycosylhydrolase [candidate division KSB1 bacterium]
MNTHRFSCLCSCVLILMLASQAFAVPSLTKGITLGGWLDEDEHYYIQTTRFTQQDFEDIQSLGCDHIRIPVNFFTSANTDPTNDISSIQYSCLDKAVQWASTLGLKLVIANTGPQIANANMPTLQPRIVDTWRNVATHFAGQGDFILYELLSTPTQSLSAENWNTIAAAIIAAIREVDTQHAIVVGPANYYSVDELANLTIFSDTNILYAFNMFDPVLFAQQGEEYGNVEYETTQVPFPYDAGSMPPDSGEVGTEAETAYNNYPTQGNVAFVQSRVDIAAAFATTNSVPVYCAAFSSAIGDGNPLTGWMVADDERATYLETIRSQCETQTIPWCFSGYRGNFGIFHDADTDPEIWEPFSNFPYDVNSTITDALGLTAPAPAFYNPESMDQEFIIYDDAISEQVRVGWWLNDGEPDFFVEDNPASGKYCMGILYPGQWNAVDFFFPAYLDMEDLATGGYALYFMIRCDDDEADIQARFEDTNMDLEDRPWRMSYQVDNSIVPFDGEWQHVSILLSAMLDQGAWDPDDQGWYGPDGSFEWFGVQRFQFVSENADQSDKELYFDRVKIAHPTAVDAQPDQAPELFTLEPNYPNPFNPVTRIEYNIPQNGLVKLSIFNIQGEQVKTLVSGMKSAGTHLATWDGTNQMHAHVASGIYIYTIEMASKTLSQRMLLLR